MKFIMNVSCEVKYKVLYNKNVEREQKEEKLTKLDQKHDEVSKVPS